MGSTPSTQSASTLEHILDGAGLGSWDWWLATNTVHFDHRWCQMLGLNPDTTPQELSTWSSRVHPDDLSLCMKDIKDHLDGKTERYENIHRMRHERTGEWVWILDRGRISERAPDGSAIRFTGTHFDITSTQKQQLLSKEIERMGAIGGWEMDLVTGETQWTPGTYRIYGVPVGTPTREIHQIAYYAPHERPRLIALINACARGTPFRERFQFGDQSGSEKWVDVFAEPIQNATGEITHLRGTFQDVTEAHALNIAFIEKSNEFERFFELSLGLLCIADVSGRFRRINPSFSIVLGYTEEEILEKPFFEFIHPEDIAKTAEELNQLKNNVPTLNFTNRYRCKDGEYRNIQWVASPDPRTGLVYAAARDVTEELKLRKSLEQAEKIAGMGSWELNLPEGNAQFSAGLRSLMGWAEEASEGSYDQLISQLHEEDMPVWVNAISESLKSDTKSHSRVRFIVNGELRWMDSRWSAITHGPTTKIRGTLIDVTQQVTTEQEIEQTRTRSIRASQLACLGELSAGLAHEVNNPLAILVGTIAAVQRSNPPPQIGSYIERMQKAANRITRIISGLKRFSRMEESAPHMQMSLNEVLLNAQQMTDHRVKLRDATLSLSMDTEVQVNGDPIEIEQVLINLIHNAADAIESLPERWIRVCIEEHDRHATIKVIDSGAGIPESLSDKLFQPFFTTKQVGQGTGLGLSISKGIMESHGGSIEAGKQDGHTCFTLTFPSIQHSEMPKRLAA